MNRNCTPCQEGSNPILPQEAQSKLKNLNDWYLLNSDKKIKKDYKFKNFKEALNFVNKVAIIAEEQNHHPDIYFTYGKCSIEIYTHKINGLHENDFILAEKIDQIIC